jgi:RNA polymerase sigma factor (sigma-70 family)
MADGRTDGLLWQVRGLVLEGAEAARGDQELLRRYLVARDEAAFAALVHRHGALVWGVCRRILSRTADAEDAFQAVFLVLARKADAIRKHESVGSWLHGVACRVARRARADRVRREQSPPARLSGVGSPEDEITWREVCEVLDEELVRLPEKYRDPLLLCYLEGLTQDEAARRLGWSPGVLRGRLDRGRLQLRANLARRGLTLSAVLAGAALAPPLRAAPVSAVVATVNAAAGRVPPPSAVVALTEGVLRTMFLTRLKTAAVLTLVLGVGGLVAGVLSGPLPAQDADPTRVRPPEAKAPDLERRVAELEKKVQTMTRELEELRGRPKVKDKEPSPFGGLFDPRKGKEEPPTETKSVTLKYSSAADVATALNEVFNGRGPKRVTIAADSTTNKIVLNGTPADLAAATALLSNLDRATNKPVGEPTLKAFTTKTADAAAVVKMLEKVYEGTKLRASALGESRIVVYASPEELNQIEAILRLIEEGEPARKPR